jgi:hypothetical protein
MARIVYGARCQWWDSIDKVATKPSGLPCCPRCGGVLFEVGSEERWWADVEAHEAKGSPGYRGFIEWLRGRCFPSYQAALDAYNAATRPFEPGDRVAVDDPALADLRRIMEKYGEPAKPNHHGTVDEVDGDTVFILFDDGGCAPYPVSETRHLPEPNEPAPAGKDT